jgi:hypothetical protein
MFLHAGLEASSSINSSQLQLQARQLHEAASSCTMLQQQLLALTNQVDPAAATLLAAAAAGDKDANAAFRRHAGGCQHNAGSRAEHSKPDGRSRQHSGKRVQGGADADGSSSLCSWLSACQRDEDSSCDAAAEVVVNGTSCDSTGAVGGGGGGVLRHLPVTMRLLLLENSLQEVSSAMANKAAAGERVQEQRCKREQVHKP